ncbi:MAG: sugar ABC transporter ATP-binding protein [Spirochaetia bacterium]|nr:sugar ABC transporter ATP-binding protein [Spirochaetia bacterium]
MSQYKLEMTDIEKSFPGVKALEKINFAVRAGTVHVLCGENGAGKSTLMKILNGIYAPDAGKIFIDGKEVHIKDPIKARSLGISMIFQELNFIPELTVEESLFLGKWPKDRFGRIDWKEIRRQTLALLASEGLSYRADQPLKELSISDIQMLEILKAISNKSQIIIMDEPTSAISNKEVDNLFDKILELKARGTSIIYISHKMEEIFQIADEITILRDGAVVATRSKKDFDIDTVISLMVGRKIDKTYPKESIPLGKTKLEVKGLSSVHVFHDVSFHISAGEIVGFAGLMGAGRTEVARAIFGLDPYSGGEIEIDGTHTKLRNVKDCIAHKVVMLSEDRRRYGIIPVRSVKENTTLASLKKIFYKGYLHTNEEEEAVSKVCSDMNVKTPSLDTPIEALSGGNQQKVVLAKWMLSDPDVLILDEPTRGIDVGAKYEIYKLMMYLAEKGKALLMISSELPELIGMCDRIYVMANGTITGELKHDEFSQETIMRLATGMGR